MARRQGGTPGAGSSLIAAAVAIFGGQRQAASALGLGRGTIQGILSGRQGVGARTVERIGASGQGERLSLVAASLSAGRTPTETAAVAKQRAVQERKEPGITERRARAYEREMHRQGLDVFGNERYDAQGRRASARRQASYEELLERYRSGDIDFTQDRYMRLRDRLEADAASDEEIGLLGQEGEDDDAEE